MKYLFSVFLLIFALNTYLPTICISQNKEVKEKTGLSRKEKKAQKRAALAAEVADAFNTKDIFIEINRIYPTGGQSKVTNNSYSFKLWKDSLTCYLPYLGEMTASAYGGIDLALKASGQRVINPQYIYDNEQNCYFILFCFINETRNEKWDCKVQLFKDRIAYIGLSCMNRSSISYEGELTKKH